jgi:hypothetical protein
MDLLARTRITCGRVSNGVHQSISALCSNGVALILWARDNARQPTGRAILAHYQYQRMTRLRERLLVSWEKLLQSQVPTIPRNLCISCRQKKKHQLPFPCSITRRGYMELSTPLVVPTTPYWLSVPHTRDRTSLACQNQIVYSYPTHPAIVRTAQQAGRATPLITPSWIHQVNHSEGTSMLAS